MPTEATSKRNARPSCWVVLGCVMTVLQTSVVGIEEARSIVAKSAVANSLKLASAQMQGHSTSWEFGRTSERRALAHGA